MKLLFIIPEYPPYSAGGISTFYRHLLPELSKLGHKVHVLVGSAFTDTQPSYELDGITVEFLDSAAVDSNLTKFENYHAVPELKRHLSAAWTAWEQVNQGQGYDLVEATDWGLLFVPWIVADNSIPSVVQLHASVGQIDWHDPEKGGELLAHLVRLLEVGLLAHADELQSYAQPNAREWNSLTQRPVTYIPPAWSSASDLNDSGINNINESEAKPLKGLVVGRIQYWKGPTFVCEALRLMGDAASTIDWVGRDVAYGKLGIPMSTYLSQTYPDIWGIKLHPVGLKSPQETAELQSKADFILVPSTWDVCNYTAIEGMGHGRVVLCSTGAGASGLINNGENGFTFSANDPVALAKSLNKLQSMDVKARQQMGALARETVKTLLHPQQVAVQRIKAYEQLINRGKYPVRPNPWLIDAVSPHSPLEQPLAFLENLTLQELSQYTLQRGLRKLMRRQA